MSGYLWKYYFEDNVDAFRHLLETSSYNTRSSASKASAFSQSFALGSPGSLGASPTLQPKSRKGATPSGITLSRFDINSKDNLGLNILQHAASSTSENAFAFALALLNHPFTDLYNQDLENGWTALHRAFYFGNISIARIIIERERQQLLGHSSGSHGQHIGGLMKIKDKEGNGPYDLFAMSIRDRVLHGDSDGESESESGEEDTGSHGGGDDEENFHRRETFRPTVNIGGDGVFTFGSNKNVTLGFGDEDDRQYPEKITLRRPDHLLQRFYREHIENKGKLRAQLHSAAPDAVQLPQSSAIPVTSLPTVVRVTSLTIQDVQMSKLHTAVLTTDPESNLYTCGHGPGGRLGTGSEATRYQFTCIEGALGGKKLMAVGLGQNHSLALSSDGEIFSWGSNSYGQLGYALPKTTLKDEEPIQTSPRQIFGPLKKESIIGVAASRIHSVAHTSSSVFIFGKNEGQLGIMDSDARSLEIQLTPRKIAASLFSSSVHSVSAIDKATICLLENHEVWVFANYGYSKVLFPLEGFANYFLKSSFLTTKYEKTPNRISKITSGGETICAMSSSGDIFTVAVKSSDPTQDIGTSTTNPTKIRSALSVPLCVWSAKKTHMVARDVGVDQDGSIILTTEAGSVWRRTKRAKIKDATALGTGEYKPKDYKFARIPGLTRVHAVRASSHGAYAAIRKDTDVTKSQIEAEEPTLWRDMAPLLSFSALATKEENSDDENPTPRYWSRPSKSDVLQRRVLASQSLEKDVAELLQQYAVDETSSYDAEICTTAADTRIPVHQFIMAGRSAVLRDAMAELDTSAAMTLPEGLELTKHESGKVTLTIESVDFLTVFDLVLYLYTDTIVSFWQFARQFPKLAYRYRLVRTELMKVSYRLGLRQLEPAARQMVSPKRTMHFDFAFAIQQPSFFRSGDILVQLSDGEARVHSAVLCQRCPFFEGMFNGRAGGMWLANRKESVDDDGGLIDIDLKHVSKEVFELVLRHVYAEAEDELFEHTTSEDLNDHFAQDELLDLIIEVMGVANELMLGRLTQICQRVVGRYVSVRNVCSLVNSIAPCSVTAFKDAALEYICLNLEAILQAGLLDELDEDLMLELDQVVQDNQLACLPIARSGRSESLLFERYPELAERIDKGKRAKIDAIVLSNKFVDSGARGSTSFRSQSLEEISSSPLKNRTRNRKRPQKESRHDANSPATTPELRGKPSTEFLFSMDEDEVGSNGTFSPPSGKQSRFEQSPDIEPIPFSLSQPALSIGSPEIPLSKSPNFVLPTDQSRPWGSASILSGKLDMKDIMAQTSGDRQSGISLAFANQPHNDRPSGSFNTKISQKERKRLQQQTLQQKPSATISNSTDQVAASPASPWSSSRLTSSTKPDSKRTAGTPQLTMRQTVANSGSVPKSQTSPSIKTPQSHRSVSGPAPQSSPASTKQRPSSSSNQAPQSSITPRSIRHTPLPDRSTSAHPQASMLHILSQQQAEKDYVNTPDKRSLEEIQQEQAFQEWWDAESKRVIQEEKDRQRKERASVKRRGGKSRGGKAKEGEKKPADQKSKVIGELGVQATSDTAPPKKPPQKSHVPSGGPANRGGRGSRGRGGRHHSDRGKSKEKQQPATQSATPAPSKTGLSTP